MESVTQQSCFTCDFRPDRVFCDMPADSLKAFDEIKSLATYPRNTILFAEGRPVRGIYLLCDGRAKLSICSDSGKRLMINGHQAFGVRVTPGTGYRVDNVTVPTGSQPEGVYMVTSSNLYNNQCCFDFGSGETSHTDTGNGHMNAIEFGSACWFGGCTGAPPGVRRLG